MADALPLPRAFNVLVTGTPGTGKSTLCALLSQELELTHIEIGKVIKEHGFHSGYDAHFDTLEVTEEDEDRLLDWMEPQMVKGSGCVVDYHSCSMFPKRWFHLVIVLRSDTQVLFDRLTQRGYTEHKREENLNAEIMNVVHEEAVESYDADVTVVRPSNTTDDLMASVTLVAEAMSRFVPPTQHSSP